ncbi:MAG: ABC transporter permease [Candidatus Bathyarchaeia archaeon]
MLTVCRKELSDHFGSKRYLILFALILLLSGVSAYQGAEYIRNRVGVSFLSIFSGAQFGFSFVQSMVFFGPILGLALGFDAINKERTSGTLSVILSQPIFRDSVINGKFVAGVAALATLTLSTVSMMCGLAIPILGFGPTLEEALSIVLLSSLTILYLAFWLSLGILFSVLTKKVSTSILASVATWLFSAIMIPILAMLIANQLAPMPIQIRPGMGNETFRMQQTPEFQRLMQERAAIQSSISKISPTTLYSEAASMILGARLPGTVVVGGGFGGGFRALTLTQSVMASWPNVAALAVGLVICFAASYMSFVRSEIRPGE